MTVTWNGTLITGPVLIYQDEILVNPFASLSISSSLPNSLVCMSGQMRVFWHLPNSDLVNITISLIPSGDFKQYRSAAGNVSGLSSNRAGIIRTDAGTNGLWTCRLNGEARGAVPVGIYVRVGGEY